MTTAKLKAPISRTAPERIKLALQEQWLKCTKLEKEFKEMKIEIENTSIAVDDEISKDVVTIFLKISNKEMTPFMQLFWQEKKNMLQTGTSKEIHYRPMVFRFCLSLTSNRRA